MTRLGDTVPTQIDPDADIRVIASQINDNFTVVSQMLSKINTELKNVREQAKLSPLGFGLPYVFGDGSVGDVIVSSNTDYDEFIPQEWRNVTINSGVTVSTNAGAGGAVALILLASETFTLNGTIDLSNKGGNGGATSSGSATDYDSVDTPATAAGWGATGGGGGGSGGNPGGSAGSTLTASEGASTIAGQSGNTLGVRQIVRIRLAVRDRDAIVSSWGTGGGGGRDGTSSSGGTGGDGGGCVIIIAQEVIFGASSVINVSGENGANGSSSAGGGGGGGGGGLIYVFSRSITDLGLTKTVSGGSAGTGNGSASNGGSGGNGTYIEEEVP